MSTEEQQDDGRGKLDIGRLHLAWWFDYAEWFSPRGYHWKNFTFIRCAFEHTQYTYSYELSLGLLGANLILDWKYREGYPDDSPVLEAMELMDEYIAEKEAGNVEI
jgi:hypothetical protein